MEFVKYQDIQPGLRELGVEEVEDADGLSRFELPLDKNLKIIHVKDPGSRVEPYPETSLVVERTKDEQVELLQQVLHRMHIAELLVLPVSSWRDLIDLVAYDLAEDEAWQEVDAISAVHQNTRNPLAVTQAEYHVLHDFAVSVFRNGSSPRHDLIITSDLTPLLIEIFHDGAISVTSDPGVSVPFEKLLA